MKEGALDRHDIDHVDANQARAQAARKMEARLAALESILDAEAPGWRTRVGD